MVRNPVLAGMMSYMSLDQRRKGMGKGAYLEVFHGFDKAAGAAGRIAVGIVEFEPFEVSVGEYMFRGYREGVGLL